MARYEHIKIFQSVYTLCLEIYKITRNFKKEYKYTLGERLKSLIHDILDLVVKTNSMPDKEKSQGLSELNYKKENLRIHIRMAFDLKMVSRGQLGILNQRIEEIGKQIGGWQKWLNQ